MHTMLIKDDNDLEWVVHHNGDFSGYLLFSCVDRRTSTHVEFASELTAHIPFDVVAEIVGRKVLRDQISALEDKTGREVLGLAY